MNEYGKHRAKAWVALIGAAVTVGLGIWGPDTKAGQVLLVAAAILTVVGVERTPNA